jgi:hypothetical protein
MGLMKASAVWILGVFVLAAALLVGCSSSKESTSGMSKEMTETKGMMDSNMDVANQLSASFKDAGSALASIRDVESAKAAVPRLEEVNSDVDGITQAASGLPSGAASGLSDVVAAQVPLLKTAMDKAYAIPGVKDVIQPQMDSLLAKYAGF